ncbi:carboxylesterase family protein [Streptomyces sp. NPDC049577]|uniref:carboxylesterase family protein n=1 Tax=Streptomyces sp. NPDC049577 TaxID=3155153 RepID=UPI0034401C54
MNHSGESVVVSTASGRLAGRREGDVTVFRGVPYAEPPVGPLRFASPRPPRPWGGVREALAPGPLFLQPGAPGSGEDCLYANVWTPEVSGSRPVLVYIHGGGWQVGGGSVPTFDGARPSAHGDIVVVTFNYRMAAFGFGLHEELADPESGAIANWGLQDQIALLHWVQDNIAAFGGDPGNITLCGTSAGGGTTYLLSLLPKVRDIVRRTIHISAMHVWQPVNSLTPEDSRAVYELLARRFGTTVPGLREVPATELWDAWAEVFSGSPEKRAVGSGREYRGPVADGTLMRGFDHELPTPDLPMMVVYNHTEGSFFTDPLAGSFPPAPPAPVDDEELREAVRGVLIKGAAEVGDALVDACVAHYRESARADGLPDDHLSLWTEVWGDALFRHQIVRLAERHAREGRSEQYLMEFAHPLQPPHSGTPHDATSKFLFASHRRPEFVGQFGDGPRERLVSDAFIELVASFARDGVPRSAHVPDWPVFSPDRPSTLILGGRDGDLARVGVTPKLRQLAFWDDADWGPRPTTATG